jgi:glutaredoxin
MYIQIGCPHCEMAQAFLKGNGVEFDSIEVGFDPVANRGLMALFNGANFTVPVTISFLTQEVIVGDDIQHLGRVVAAARGNSPVALNNAAKSEQPVQVVTNSTT